MTGGSRPLTGARPTRVPVGADQSRRIRPETAGDGLTPYASVRTSRPAMALRGVEPRDAEPIGRERRRALGPSTQRHRLILGTSETKHRRFFRCVRVSRSRVDMPRCRRPTEAYRRHRWSWPGPPGRQPRAFMPRMVRQWLDRWPWRPRLSAVQPNTVGALTRSPMSSTTEVGRHSSRRHGRSPSPMGRCQRPHRESPRAGTT